MVKCEMGERTHLRLYRKIQGTLLCKLCVPSLDPNFIHVTPMDRIVYVGYCIKEYENAKVTAHFLPIIPNGCRRNAGINKFLEGICT